jgi:hypothetical protein
MKPWPSLRLRQGCSASKEEEGEEEEEEEEAVELVC